MISSLFANLWSYEGVVALNGFFLFGTYYLLFRTADKMGSSIAWLILVAPFLFRSAIPYSATALTEPLAGFYIAGLLFLIIKERWLTFYLLCSISYLFRQELIILIPTALAIGVYRRDLRSLTVLSGLFIFETLTYLFNPVDFLNSFTGGYNTGESVYGSGDIGHFFNRMSRMTGSPLYVMLSLIIALYALAISAKRYFTKGLKESPRIAILVAAIVFLGVFGAHSLVWYKGVFASAGMERVLNPIIPIGLWLIIISISKLKNTYQYVFALLFSLLFINENFISNRLETAYRYSTVFKADPVREMMKSDAIFDDIQATDNLHCNHPAIALYLDLNPKLEECFVDGQIGFNDLSEHPTIIVKPHKEVDLEFVINSGWSYLIQGDQILVHNIRAEESD